MSGICAFDPHRLHVIAHGEHDPHKVTAAWSAAAVASFMYLLLAAVLIL